MSLVFSFLTACGGGSDSASVSLNAVKQYQGFVQKGPFGVGTNVVISQLDSSGIPTGDLINTKIEDVSGRFTYQLPNDWNIGLETGSLKISAEGFFFDEYNGKKSDKKINLSAITNSPEFSSVNLLTNWAVNRVETLLQDGKSLASAIDQSKSELFNIFGVDNIHQLDIAQLDSFASDNALLLLLSGALMEVAEQNTIDPQQISNEIAIDFSDDGKLSELGNDWFIRLQARIRDNPQYHVDLYAKTLKSKRNLGSPKGEDLPKLIPLASRPSAVLPKEITVEPGALVTLDGSGSHDNPIEDEGRLINYTWFRVDQIGAEIPFSNRFIANPTITAPSEETERLFALVVTDEQKLTDTAVIKVIVKKPPVDNNPPIADSQIDTNGVFTSEDVSISVVLTGSDPDSDPITFITASLPLLLSGGVIDGTPPNLVYTPTPNFHGTDSFNFTVNDGFEDSNTATVEITIASVNDAPIANAGLDQSVVSGDLVNLSGSGIDIDGTIATYSWVQISGITTSLSDSSIATPEFTAPQIGSVPETLIYQLIVTDNEGAQSLADTVEIIVDFTSTTNNPPAAVGSTDKGAITLEAVLEGELVTLTGHLSTDDGTIIEYVWEQIIEANHPTVSLSIPSDPTKAIFTAPMPNANNAPLVLKFKLTVKDDGTPSLESNTEVLVHINSRPFADAGNDRTVTKNDNVTLSGSGSFDREGAIKTYAWQQQVGTVPQVTLNNANTATPNFSAPNVSGADVDLYFELIVTDNNDVASIKDTVKITVQETCVTPAPIASVGVDRHVPVRTPIGALTVVTLNGSGLANGSCQYENYIDDYVWTQIGPTAITHPVILSTTNPYSGNRPFFTVPDVTTITVLEFQLVVDDWVGGNTSSAPVTMAVTVYPSGANLPPNDPPIGSDYNVEVLGNGNEINIYLQANDPDGDNVAMTYTIITDTTTVPLDQGSIQYGSVGFTPNVPVPLMDSFTFTATDQDGNTSAPIKVTINKIVEPSGNQAPTASSATIIVSPLQSSYFGRREEVLLEQLYITNPDLAGVDDYIKIVGVVIDPPLPAIPTVTIDLFDSSTNGKYLRFTNDPGSRSGQGIYEYYVIDKYGRTSTTERITVEFVNTKPVANPQTVATLSSASGATIGSVIFPIDLTGSDIDTNPGLTYEIVTLPDPPKNITFDLIDFTTTGKLKFGSSITTPNPFTFTFRVIDKEGLASDPALVTVEGYIYVP